MLDKHFILTDFLFIFIYQNEKINWKKKKQKKKHKLTYLYEYVTKVKEIPQVPGQLHSLVTSSKT